MAKRKTRKAAAKPHSKPIARKAVEPARISDAVFDERAPRQGPLGPIERKTEADLIAEGAHASSK